METPHFLLMTDLLWTMCWDLQRHRWDGTSHRHRGNGVLEKTPRNSMLGLQSPEFEADLLSLGRGDVDPGMQREQRYEIDSIPDSSNLHPKEGVVDRRPWDLEVGHQPPLRPGYHI